MSDKTYRIRTTVGRNGNDRAAEQCVNVKLDQTFDTLEIMSLKLDQTNAYKYYTSDYGVIVGRVIANGGFGIPNAKVSIFIEVDENDSTQSKLLYGFVNTNDTNHDGVVYNLLPDSVDSACHQNVGTFPNKRLVLDNNDVIEIFEKYWKYTTTTNQSGDYMLFGVPTGNQTLHVDLDLSDCGVLSQRPRDMIAQGSDANLFESPNKFKQSTNLKSLTQIKSQDQGVYVYPYWGETNESGETIAVTRCDIDIQYKFEPTCIFIGSMVTDKGSNAIGKNCTGDEKLGRMSDLATGEGMIEMIRKTIDNRVEEYPIMGNRLIDGDGVWCYQIPMNLDYVTTDEFGNMVPTDNPDKGIPTRARVRFRMTLDESPDDATARKRCRYLVPNNPRIDEMNPEFSETHQEDYEFGSATREESYRDLFWNKVYTVKNYIPKLQKNRNVTNRKHTGIKLINHFGDNNPMPYNSLNIKLSFMFRLICVLTKIVIYIIMMINYILGVIMTPFCLICKILRGLGKIPLVGFVFKALAAPFCAMVISCIKLSSEFCDDGINKKTYYPGCWGCQRDETDKKHNEEQAKLQTTNPEEITIAEYPQLGNVEDSTLMTCIENSLAQDNDATSFNFANDWVNGVLYAPLWYRKIRPKKKFLFGLFTRKAKDEWCDANRNFGLMVFQTCAVRRNKGENTSSPYDGKDGYGGTTDHPSTVDVYTLIEPTGDCGKNDTRCHETKTTVNVNNGLIVTKETLMGQTVYYYRSVEYNPVENDVTLLFATDIVLLGSLNDCDLDGIPQFYRSLEPSSFIQPTDILFTDTEIVIDDSGESVVLDYSSFTEATGADWGNLNSYDECGKMGKDDDGGLFYGIGCNSIEMKPKTVLNMSRICEFGVSIDNLKHIADLNKLEGSDDDSSFDRLVPDGFVSYDELFNHNERSMFATLNGNRLRTRLNKTNGLPEYDFRHYYIDNFDGGMRNIMQRDLQGCNGISYQNNYKLERYCPDYYLFRMGEKPYFYNSNSGLDPDHRLPRYENSFYFYFGLKNGKTAIEKFNSQFFAPCETISGDELKIGIVAEPNDWCSELSDNPDDRNGYVKIDLTDIAIPYDIIINSRSDSSIGYSFDGQTDEKIYVAAHEMEFDDYVPVKDSDNNNVFVSLPNGDYEITITDNNGDIMSSLFSMGTKKLSFTTTPVDFTTPNNLKSTYPGATNADKVKAIINDTLTNIDYNEDNGKWTSKIGGIILLTSVIDSSTENGKYVLTVKPRLTLEGKVPFEDFKGKSINFELIDNDIVATDKDGFKIVVNPITGKHHIAIGVPYGDWEYLITVTQVCDGIESANTSNSSVKVNDPLPYKLFINDIDIDVFKKDKFNTGWTNITNTGSTGTPNINSVSGWDDLSNVSNYDWEKLTDYQKIVDEEDQLRNQLSKDYSTTDITTYLSMYKTRYEQLLSDELSEDMANAYREEINTKPLSDFADLYSQIIKREEFISDYITRIKETFWITCPSDTKSLVFRLNTQEYPVYIQGVYNSEELEGTVTNLHVLSGTTMETTNGGNSITDIGIPTLGNHYDETYGDYKNNPESNNNYHNDDTNKGDRCFGYDRINNWYKKPYFVAAYNGKEESIPDNISVSNIENASNLDKFFSFHIIDKALRFPMLAWSYVNGVPYFYKNVAEEDENKVGNVITINGLLTGFIYNGIVKKEPDGTTYFEEQTLGVKKLTVKTIDANEDRIPTRRYVSFNGGVPEYPDYHIDALKDKPHPQYQPVLNRNDSVALEDNSCTIEETVYGKMSVRLGASSVCDWRNDSDNPNVLQVSTSNGDTSGDTRFFIFNLDEQFYPLNNVTDGVYNGTNYGIMAYEVTLDKLTTGNFVDTDIKVTEKDSDGNEVIREGYSANGQFTGFGEGCYFIVAITENNCRSLSPVYDFRPMTVDMRILEQDGSYKLGIKVLNAENNHYYLKYFDFSVNINVDVSDSPISGNVTMAYNKNLPEDGNGIPETNWDKTKQYSIQNGDGTYEVKSYLTNVITNANELPESSTPFIIDDVPNLIEDEGPYYIVHYLTDESGNKKEDEIIYIECVKQTGTTADGERIWAVEAIESNVLPAGAKIIEDNFTILTGYREEVIPPAVIGDPPTINKYYTYTEYTVEDRWETVETSDVDPTMKHYEKWADIVITESQYRKIEELIGGVFGIIGKQRIINASTITVTDTVGLPHICKINNIIKSDS